ncbi:phosphodiester glycosidase family protein [Leuconostoc mesenteroides]|uniref:phosphodiester glycosidase family protein n=1 Tax=Leuconostoc mesenteroides TaxID=1245 RepID=UPI0023631912|nr:phosphodiester glycosidase family protein [Leuconostoc mesenteroides]
MEKLKTNELPLGLDQTFRNDLIDNFETIQDGVDNQNQILLKEIETHLGGVRLQDQNEVSQARIDKDGKNYETLKSRIDDTQSTAETSLEEERKTKTEVESARTNNNSKTYESLKKRLDEQENDLTNNMNYKISQISSIPETFSSLVDLKNSYPNGKQGLFVTADNGHKYIWANNSWNDAGVYQSVGIADETVTPEKTTFIDNRVDFEIEIGSISNGLNSEVVNPNRLRTKGMLKNRNGLTIVRKNENLQYGVARYVDGMFDYRDSGWINNNETYIEPGKDVRFNIRKADNSEFTSDEIKNIYNDFEVKFTFRSADYYDLEDVKTDVKNNLFEYKSVSSSEFEYGGIGGNTPAATVANRARLKEFIQLNKNDKIVFNKDRNILIYGISVSNIDGTWNNVDYGWMNDKEFIVPHDSLIKMTIRYKDNRDIIDSDFNNVTDNAFTLVKMLKNKVENNARLLTEQNKTTEKKDAINSISVEYGRLSGASYVFVRIPKTTNTGKILSPKLALTSSDGSLSGTKRPTLRYAKDNDTIFAVNAGLFNMSTVEPVGQLIIDGVSLINTPMTSDNGVPISPDECYPLAIDGNGNLTTYPHNADTADMIAGGVKYAVTAWGKLVDNFEITTVDIENEIVHNSYPYIRQSIGQYQNGDYCVLTVDMKRGPVTNEAGLYYKDLAQIFVDKGVKFAYSLDGGGSSETVLGKRQLNPIYEGSKGRAVPTVIVFEIDK